jgi:hypothetical protein
MEIFNGALSKKNTSPIGFVNTAVNCFNSTEGFVGDSACEQISSRDLEWREMVEKTLDMTSVAQTRRWNKRQGLGRGVEV